jgi:hypothetical protein
MDSQDELDATVRRARQAVRRDPAGERAQLDRALTEQALYMAANRYVVVIARQARGRESNDALLQARQRSLGAAALHYAHARGWQAPADWEPPAAASAAG